MCVCLFFNFQPYAIWNPDFRHTRTRYPTLVGHLGKFHFNKQKNHYICWEQLHKTPLKVNVFLYESMRQRGRHCSLMVSRHLQSGREVWSRVWSLFWVRCYPLAVPHSTQEKRWEPTRRVVRTSLTNVVGWEWEGVRTNIPFGWSTNGSRRLVHLWTTRLELILRTSIKLFFF